MKFLIGTCYDRSGAEARNVEAEKAGSKRDVSNGNGADPPLDGNRCRSHDGARSAELIDQENAVDEDA